MPDLISVAGLPREEASIVLAAAAMRLSPHAGSAGQNRISAERAEKVIEEVRERLNLGSDDQSDRAVSLLMSYFTDAIREAVLDRTKLENAVDRASQKGQLPVEAYTISRHGEFRSVRPNQIDGAMKYYDLVQHISNKDDITRSVPQFSIFAKFSKAAQGIEDRWLIVSAARIQRRLEVYSAWWVFPSIVEIRNDFQPIDFLKSFLNIFGVEVVAGTFRGKFLESADVRFEDLPDHAVHGLPLRVIDGTRGNLISGVAMRDDIKKLYHIRLAYAVNIEKYSNFLFAKKLRSNQTVTHNYWMSDTKNVIIS